MVCLIIAVWICQTISAQSNHGVRIIMTKLKILNCILPHQLQKLNCAVVSSTKPKQNILTCNSCFMNSQYLKVQVSWFVPYNFYCKINKYSNQLSNISNYYLNVIFEFIISSDVLVNARKCGSGVQRLWQNHSWGQSKLMTWKQYSHSDTVKRFPKGSNNATMP